MANLADLFKSIAPTELRQLAQAPAFRQFAALLHKTGLFPGGGSPGGDPITGLPLDHGNPAQIAGILPDQHHGQVHGLDTTDHTGTLPESKLTLNYPTHSNALDHARQHAIDATVDHSFPHAGGMTWLDDEGNFTAPTAARIFLGSTAPIDPLPGDLWIKTV